MESLARHQLLVKAVSSSTAGITGEMFRLYLGIG